MENIQMMISKYNWKLQCWEGRYSEGMWLVLTPALYQANEIQEITESDCDSNRELFRYFDGKGSWLPIVIEKDLNKALENINKKVERLTKDEDSRTHVYDAFNRVLAAQDGYFGLDQAVKNNDELLVLNK